MNRSLATILVFFLLLSCDSIFLDDENDNVRQMNSGPPEYLNDGWEVSSPEAEHADADALVRLIQDLQKDSRNIHGLLIAKNNKLIAEAYFDGWHRNRLQSLRSASKSLASTLVGIAIDQGHIKDVNQSIFDFFPEYTDLNTSGKDKIQLQHVLSMKAGLRWNQDSYPDDDPRNDEYQLKEANDGFRYLLQKDVVAPPGTVFQYNSGCSDLLLGIVDHSTGMTADKFAEEYLFTPLGIKEYGWRKNHNGYPNGAYGLHLFPRDMLKIGQLFLDGGKWKQQQIISTDWINRATQDYSELGNGLGYGFQWWTKEGDVNGRTIKRYQAQGKGGQIICIVPELKAVVVLTGTNYSNAQSQIPYNILQSRILPVLDK